MDLDYKAVESADQFSKNVDMININREDANRNEKSFFEQNFERYQDEFSSVCTFLQNTNKDLNKCQNALQFIKWHGFILQNEEIIPRIIEIGILNNILSLIKDFPSDVYDILVEIIDCSIDSIILLLKKGIGSVLIEGLKCKDDDIFEKSMKCFSIILSKWSEYYDYNVFLYLIIISTNVIDIITDRIKGKELSQSTVKTLMKFSYVVFEKIPSSEDINLDSLNDLFENFFSQCQNSSIYNYDICKEIIEKGVSFTEESKYFNLLIQSFSNAINSDDPQIIYDFCHIIFTIFTYNINTCSLILDNLQFLDHSEQWVKLNDPKIFNIYLIIIAYLLSECSSLSSEYIEKISSVVFYIFDSSSMIDNEDIKLSLGITLQNLISINENFIANFIDENRISLICSNIIFCSFKVSKNYAYLYLLIASNIDDFSKVINEEIIEKILGFMEKGKGEFVCNALHHFNLILEKQQIQKKNDLLDAIIKLDGVDLINDMMNSENEFISEMSFNISSRYFPQYNN